MLSGMILVEVYNTFMLLMFLVTKEEKMTLKT